MEKLVTAFLIDLIKEHYNHFYKLALKSELQHGFSLDLQQYVIIFGTEEQPCRIEISGIELYAFIYSKLPIFIKQPSELDGMTDLNSKLVGKLICINCNEVFDTKQDLESHINEKHNYI